MSWRSHQSLNQRVLPAAAADFYTKHFKAEKAQRNGAPAVWTQKSWMLFTKVWPSAARRLPHIYFRIVNRLLGVRIEVSGEPVYGKPCLYVANHMSWLDILVLSAVRPMCFIAKKEVAGWPLFGILATVGRTLYIDRDRRHDVKGSRAAVQKRFADLGAVDIDNRRALAHRLAALDELGLEGEAWQAPPQRPAAPAWQRAACGRLPSGRAGAWPARPGG